jgi:hypothetical protein
MTPEQKAELRRLAEGATQGEWYWTIQDKSMASLGAGNDPGYETPLIMNVGPCSSCCARMADWEWGRCHTPNEANARVIAAANPATILALLDALETKE